MVLLKRLNLIARTQLIPYVRWQLSKQHFSSKNLPCYIDTKINCGQENVKSTGGGQIALHFLNPTSHCILDSVTPKGKDWEALPQR